MRTRCAATRAVHGRGTSAAMCDDWQEYQTFRCWALSTGYAPDHSIERLDKRVGYSPANCRWTINRATKSLTRRSAERREDGTPWVEVAEAHDIPLATYNNRRLRGGWSPEMAATWPVGKLRNSGKARGANGRYLPQGQIWKR